MHHTDYPGDLLVHLASHVALLRRMAAPGAFETAAQELGVDRSVLRRRMQTLSDWIGAPLLEGRGVAMQATPEGERVAEQARVLLRGVERLREEAGTRPVRITVGCTGTITTELLADVLVASRRQERAPAVNLRRAGGSACASMLASGLIDIGIVRADAESSVGTRLCEDRLWLLVPKNHPLGATRRLRISHLVDQPLVLYPEGSRTRRRILERLGERAEVVVEVEGKAAALEYVRRGLGVSFISAVPWYQPRARGVVARDVSRLFGRVFFHLQVAPSRRASPDVQRFAELICAEVSRKTRDQAS